MYSNCANPEAWSKVTFTHHLNILYFLFKIYTFIAIMQCNAEDNPVSTFLQLCYFYKRFGSSFWGEEKRKVRRPATIQQLQSWWKTHLPYDKRFYGASLHILTSHHIHCPGALSPNLSSQALLQNCWDWAFSTEPNESDLSLIVPSCNSYLVFEHTPWPLSCSRVPVMGLQAGWAQHREGCACWCSSVLRTLLGNACSLPQCDSKNPGVHSSLACTCRT